MKIIVKGLAIYIATFALSAAAQNTFPASGNVGIGTTAPTALLDVNGSSGTTQTDVAKFDNSINGSYTAIASAGSASIVPTWTNGTQIVEFVPYSSGNGVISTYTGSLLFQTNYRTNQMALTSAGNVGIGTTSPAYKLDVAGTIRSTSGGIVFPDGTTQATAFIPANCGADFAESVDITGGRTEYEPGDILVIDPNAPGKFLKSTQAYSTLVAGIYSTKPGFVGRLHPQDAKTDKTEVPMAMVGRVPTKVSAENGPIKVGDLLVSSSTLGYAMKGTDRNQMLGAVVGKALGSLDSGKGVIEVLVTLQ
jgi:hypothetical protein